MQAYGITLAQMTTAMANGNVNVGGREVANRRAVITLRGLA